MHPSLRNRLPLYPGQFVAGVVMVSLGPLLDPIMRDLRVPLSRGGLIAAAFFLGQIAGVLVLNAFLAKVPVKWTAAGGALLQAAALAAGALFAKGLGTLFLAYVLVGFGWAFVNTICWMWVPSHVKEKTASATLLMIFFFAVGMTITPLVLGPSISAGVSWRWILACEGGLSLILAAVFAALPLLDIPGRENLRARQIREVSSFNPGLLLGILGGAFLYTGAEACFSVWLPKFMLDTFNASQTWASLSVTSFWIGLLAGRLIVAPISHRLSPARLVTFCCAALAILAVGIAVSPSQATCLALAAGAGLAASASYGLIGSYTALFPAWHAGVASSAFVLAGAAGSMIFPYLTGPAASAGGFRLAIALTAVPAFGCALVALYIHARSGERSPRVAPLPDL